MRGAAVAVIGGGVIGASVAWHLAKLGFRDVVVLDRARGPGAGSTGKATGGFRAQFATPVNVRLSLISRQSLLRFQDDTGVDPGYAQTGYLWLASDQAHVKTLRAARQVQHAEGLNEAVELAPDDISAINPAISLEGIVGAAFCPTDGYIQPLEILRGYLEDGAREGVRVLWNTECRGITLDANGRIRGLRTTSGEIPVDAVVNAAGAWASNVAAMAGVQLPVVPVRRQAAVTEPTDSIRPDMPMTLFMDTGFHVRARNGRAVFSWPNAEPPGEPRELRAEPEWIDAVTMMARQRVPTLRDTAVDRELCYAGLYEMSPDSHAILGFSTECENLFLVNGSSGHGVMHSPALGAAAAALMAGRPPATDVSSLRPSRFAEGAGIVAGELI